MWIRLLINFLAFIHENDFGSMIENRRFKFQNKLNEAFKACTYASFSQKSSILIAETSVRTYIRLQKFSVFVHLCVWCDDATAVAEIIQFAWNLAQIFMCCAKLVA